MINETISFGGRRVAGFGVGACPVIRPEGIYIDGRRVIRLGLDDEAPPQNMTNPAAENCIAKGGRISGELCIFPDGSHCEQWAFFRGTCAPGDSNKKGVATLVAVSLASAAVGGVIGNRVKKGGSGAVIGTLVGGAAPVVAGLALMRIIYWKGGEAG